MPVWSIPGTSRNSAAARAASMSTSVFRFPGATLHWRDLGRHALAHQRRRLWRHAARAVRGEPTTPAAGAARRPWRGHRPWRCPQRQCLGRAGGLRSPPRLLRPGLRRPAYPGAAGGDQGDLPQHLRPSALALRRADRRWPFHGSGLGRRRCSRYQDRLATFAAAEGIPRQPRLRSSGSRCWRRCSGAAGCRPSGGASFAARCSAARPW